MARLILPALLAFPLLAHTAPLRLPDGRPFACVYYFGHWWDPWKSDDDAIRKDFAALKEMGISVIACDHEWSQAIDGNFRWLDREHKLAKEAGLQILPWLSAKTWCDLSDPGRPKLIKEQYGVDLKLSETQDGKPGCVIPWDEATSPPAPRIRCSISTATPTGPCCT